MSFAQWIHHLFNPHCEQCKDESVCQSCEILTMQLSIANHEKQQMLNTILAFTKPEQSQTSPAVDYENIKPKMMTWNIRRQMLEAEDRKQAQLLAEQQKKKSINEQIADLEKEVGIDEGVKSDA